MTESATSPESLLHLNAADIRHIAEMKAAQHSYFKWVIGLGGAFIGLQYTRAIPPDFSASVGLGVALIAGFTAVYIWDCHLSMVRKRERLWKVYKDLHLGAYIGKVEAQHTSIWYGWKVWIPMMLICGFVAGWSAEPFFKHLWN